MRVSFFLLVLIAGYIAVLYTFQTSVIFPGAATQGRPESVARLGPGGELTRLTTSHGGEVVALYGPALQADGRAHPDPASRPALVYFYGNAMCLAYSAAEFDRFRRLGLNVLIPDYLGYGMSGGKPSEAGCRETAESCYQHLMSRGFRSDQIFAGGWSLGGAVAIDLASRQPVAGLFAFSTFTSVREMSRAVVPLPLPGVLFKHKFDSLSKISKLTCPVLLGHGRADSIVPFSMYERLAAATKAPLSKLIVDRADHNDFCDVGGQRIDEAIEALVANDERSPGVLDAFQANMIFPGAATQGRPEAVVRPGPGGELARLTTSHGDEVVALYGPALQADGRAHPDPASRPALVYFYGNAMCLAYSAAEFDRFRRLGLNVLIPDYLGYGMSGGKPSEAGCRETAESCYQHLMSRGFRSDQIFAGGWSLGGAVAIDLASRQPVAGLFAFSTFTSVREMSRAVVPLPLPGVLFKHKFDSLSKIPKLTCPVLLGHGRNDPLVPFSMFERLAAATKSPLTKLIVDRAEHNDFFDVGGRRIDEAIKKLVAAVGSADD
ncbi:alpha/beta hydrolase [Paludisphaera borealis]|nr:alpha/beta hydrolase [Paludisphaera borealis]